MQRRTFIQASGALVALNVFSPYATANEKESKPMLAKKAFKALTIKDVTIGEGSPKIIVPTTDNNAADILHAVENIVTRDDVNIIELRLDTITNGEDAVAMAALSRDISSRLKDKLLLVTFRTKAEGGKKSISDEGYVQLLSDMVRNGQLDLLDIEMFREHEGVMSLVALAHRHNVPVIMSSHDFKQTPSQQEIVTRLRQQQAMGADILKMAAMPKDAGDVLTMMSATWEVFSQYAERPLLTMSMGGKGALSRMSGELTGSALTFAMVGEASAPGQIAADQLHSTIDLLHKQLS